jgi:hypothetical protein
MKLFKQRGGIWFNRSKDTYGTLWADRFKSQLVQDGGNALRTVAAYIDLNGVLAGQAQDPKHRTKRPAYPSTNSGALQERGYGD